MSSRRNTDPFHAIEWYILRITLLALLLHAVLKILLPLWNDLVPPSEPRTQPGTSATTRPAARALKADKDRTRAGTLSLSWPAPAGHDTSLAPDPRPRRAALPPIQ